MSYADILRQTRLMALPPTLKASLAHNTSPTSPAIRTSKAGQGTGDWGLKRNLPKLRMNNITISDIDTQEHQTPFKSGNKYTKVVQRWQEMGIPLRSRQKPTGYADAMQEDRTTIPVGQGIHLGSAPRKQVLRLVKTAAGKRRSFLASQDLQSPVYTQQVAKQLRQAGQEFLGIVPGYNRVQSVQPNAGLAYHPHGALSLINTAEGPKERTLVARHISSGRNTTSVGLGGILSELQQQVDNNHARGRQNTVVVYANEMEFAANGSLNIQVSTTRPQQIESARSRGISPFLEKFDQRFPGQEEAYTDEDMEFTGDNRLRSPEAMNRLGALLKSSPVGKPEQNDEKK